MSFMPTLPTFTVTQAQADRLLAAFGSVENYQNWLKNQLVTFVLNKEMESANEAMEAQVAAKRAELNAFM
jgi:hypothetical protein